MAPFQNLAELAQALHQAAVVHDQNSFMNLLQENVLLNPGPSQDTPESAIGLQTLLRPRLPEPPKPEFFFGADNKHPLVRTWLFQLRQYFRLWPTMGDSEKINYAVTLLRSHAMNWWEQQEQLIRLGTAEEFDTFEKFEQAITKQFGGFDTVERARDILANMRQVSSVETYVRRFREALLLLGADNYLDSDMCNRFILGLKPWVQRLVKIETPDTLDKAMQMAERIDRVRASGPDRNPGQMESPGIPAAESANSRPHFTDSAQATPMEIDAITPDRHRPRFKKLTDKEKQQLIQNNGCFYCRKAQAGHTSRNCPEKLGRQ
jgi:hypothetical protein